MPTITTPSSIFDHTLDPVAGYDITPAHRLEFTAKMAAAVTLPAYPGRVITLNANGEWEYGCKPDAMPCFLQPMSIPIGHLAVEQALNPARGWAAVGGFTATGLVATGAYEIASSEFVRSETYAVNDFLTAKASNDEDALSGVLTHFSPGTSTKLTPPWRNAGTTRTICGQVSIKPTTWKNGQTVLQFWAIYFPGST